jgi:protein FAM32A
VSETYQETNASEVSVTLTKTQENLMRAQMENEKLSSTKPQKTYREKVNEFNDKLSTLTEHNDIPRISAAGNG